MTLTKSYANKLNVPSDFKLADGSPNPHIFLIVFLITLKLFLFDRLQLALQSWSVFG